METMLVVGYLGCTVVAVTVIKARAGVGIWGRPKIFGPDGFGPVWTATTIVSAMFWLPDRADQNDGACDQGGHRDGDQPLQESAPRCRR